MLHRILEAILFAADGPLGADQIAIAVPDTPIEEIEGTLIELRERYENEERGWRLDFLAGGWQLRSHPDLFPYIERFLEGRRRARLSRAALETLAVIAYRQPITRGELEDLRGVDCGGVLQTLLERDLVAIRGRSKAIGRPLIYATTERFLEHFGLSSLADLPRLEEVENLWASDDIRGQIEAEITRRLAAADAGGNGNGGGNGDGAGTGEGTGNVEGTGTGEGSGGAPSTILLEEEQPAAVELLPAAQDAPRTESEG